MSEPIYSVLTGKITSGFILTNVPSWSVFQNLPYTLEGQYFCPSHIGFMGKGVEGLNEPPWLGGACQPPFSNCVFNSDNIFQYRPDFWNEGAWSGWVLYVDTNTAAAYNNSTDSVNFPTSGWYEWANGGPGNNNSSAAFTFTPYSC